MPDFSIGNLRGGFCVYWRKPDGKRTRFSLQARSRAQAEAEALDVWRKENRSTLSQKVADFWEAYRDHNHGRQISTTMFYTGKSIRPHGM
ncbi:hypothetical protein OAN307_c33130 [Octadecabacter antarcticus 307]|uniref:Uncharacterized protein n=1 Tax=Octadecabacter antarcticus 307 TaxID=391626 RepID=M9R9D5_9RHOB|nr:hypothetical protein OAN307_c33130 [Octadecabacter antarcticus 307]